MIRGLKGSDLKEALGPPERRDAVGYLVAEHGVSIRQACATVGLPRATWYQPPRGHVAKDGEVIGALLAIAEVHRR